MGGKQPFHILGFEVLFSQGWILSLAEPRGELQACCFSIIPSSPPSHHKAAGQQAALEAPELRTSQLQQTYNPKRGCRHQRQRDRGKDFSPGEPRALSPGALCLLEPLDFDIHSSS